jgi:hypothetical protein
MSTLFTTAEDLIGTAVAFAIPTFVTVAMLAFTAGLV